MSKFTVSIPLVSYYEVEIEAESEVDARLAVARLPLDDITQSYYTGWDIDFSNLGINEITHQHSTVESIITCEKEPCATLLAPETA